MGDRDIYRIINPSHEERDRTVFQNGPHYTENAVTLPSITPKSDRLLPTIGARLGANQIVRANHFKINIAASPVRVIFHYHVHIHQYERDGVHLRKKNRRNDADPMPADGLEDYSIINEEHINYELIKEVIKRNSSWKASDIEGIAENGITYDGRTA
eukprot:gene10421-13374_t